MVDCSAGKPWSEVVNKVVKVIVEEGCTSISKEAFSTSAFSVSDNPSEITSVSIPDTVTSIGKWAFLWCVSLKNITIPNSVTTIGSEAFLNCDNLQTVEMGRNTQILNRSGDTVEFLGNYDCHAEVIRR